MNSPLSTYMRVAEIPAQTVERAATWRGVQAQANLPDPLESAAGYGRWWLDSGTSQLVLSSGAANFLDVEAGLHDSLESCFTHIVPEDMLTLLAVFAQAGASGIGIDCEFRVIKEAQGLHWLQMKSLPQSSPASGVQHGVLIDVTASKHVAMRERFSFEATQFLVGAHQMDEAVIKVIQLVCENLGWEWGAYWSLQQGQMNQPQKLTCKHYWNFSEHTLAPFTHESRALQVTPGQGLIGHVWSSGQAAWTEDIKSDTDSARNHSLKECGLRSGYAFPVSYLRPDGRRHSVGVLEFFSSLARQREAQLPNLSEAIGALIAQTVQRMEQQEYIRRLAQSDDLTGLANRNHFHHLLDMACFNATKSGGQFGVLYIDLDRFKPINDAFGHDAGNVVLREFAQRLQATVSDGSHIGRLGGDEFVILKPLLHATNALLQLQTLAERVLLAARLPFHFEGNELTVSASIGISIFSENGWTGQELLRSADAAMYRSKNNGRNAVSFFSGSGTRSLAEQQSSLAQTLTMEAELHKALVEEEFFLEYQPVFDNFTHRMVAIEALIRWRHPNGHIVRPDVFIPIAEKSRLIVQIGRWVVKQACRDLSVFHMAGFDGLKVNVNMAAAEFTNASLPYELTAVSEACGIQPRDLCLELTEGTVMKHPEKVIPVMHMLRQLGFHISLDDFGIGHSSLSRLKKLPLTSVKIDRSFVSGLPNDRGDGAIVRTILDLGRHMKLQVIAEGVETDAQLLYLGQFGCTLVQGYLLSRPLPMNELIALHRPH